MTSASRSQRAERIGRLLNVPVTGVRTVGAQHGYEHLTATLGDGREVFVKADRKNAACQALAFAAEANGLRWLAAAAAVPVPQVLGADENLLVIELLPPGGPTVQAAAGVRRRPGTDARRGRAVLRRAVARVHRQPAAGQHAGDRVGELVRGAPARSVSEDGE